MISSPVVTSARRILRRRSLVVAVVLSLALLCVAVAVWLVVADQWLNPLILGLPTLAVAMSWSLARVLRSPLPVTPTVVVDRSNAAPLLDLVAELARTLDGAPPDEVALTPHCSVRLEHHGRKLVLEIGAPLLWALDRKELRAVLAPAVAASPEMRSRAVRTARAVARRLEYARLDGRVTTPLLKLLLASCRRNGSAMEMELIATTVARSSAVFRPDLHSRLVSIEETWAVLVGDFAVPALRRGLRPKRLCSGFAGLSAGSDLMHKGCYVPGWSAARTLLTEPDWIDRSISKVVAKDLWSGRVNDSLEWSHYTERVLGPMRREQAAELLAAVDTVLGIPGPGTLDRVLDAIDLGAARAITAVLTRDRRHQRAAQAEADAAEHVLVRFLAALVECAAVTTGRSRLVLSWLTGAAVVNDYGCLLALDDEALEFAAQGDTRELRSWLDEQSISLTDPVWVSGDERPDVGPAVLAAMTDVWHRGRLYDLVVCEDRLVFVRSQGRGLDMPGMLDQAAGEATTNAASLPAHLRGDVTELLARSKRSFQLEFSDITDTQLRAYRRPLLWRCAISTPDRRVILRNGLSGRTATTLRDLLRPSLGDRFRDHGLEPRDAPQKRLIAG